MDGSVGMGQDGMGWGWVDGTGSGQDGTKWDRRRSRSRRRSHGCCRVVGMDSFH